MMFKRELARAIVEGKKTATRRAVSTNPRSPWRPWNPNDHSYPVDNVFTVNPGRGVPRIAECEVTGRGLSALGSMTEETARAEGFPDLEAFQETWLKINGNVKPSTPVHVVEFVLVKVLPS